VIDVVFDPVVFVRSPINPRSIWGELVFNRRDRYRLVVSEPMSAEILDVIQRPEISKKFKSLGEYGASAVHELLGEAVLVDPVEIEWSGRDPKDNVFITTAIAAGARYVVSEDRDLLDLGQFENVEIVDTASFLQIVRHQ
jgi:putative PIN family toxin of toxin-antitoxin system